MGNKLTSKVIIEGTRLIFCHWSPESFEFARQERLKISGHPSQYDNLELLIREQTLMEELVNKSKLPIFKVDISNNDIPKAVTCVVDRMDSTGGLSMEGSESWQHKFCPCWKPANPPIHTFTRAPAHLSIKCCRMIATV